MLLICDEVATGFGRTGTMFACEQEAITPDLLCLAKGISGGYLPLAATLATERVYSAFLGDYERKLTFFHGHTYTGNPLACAAGLASLDIFERERVIERLQPKVQNQHAVFLVTESEALDYHYELDLRPDISRSGPRTVEPDPRVAFRRARVQLVRTAAGERVIDPSHRPHPRFDQ